MTRRLALMFVAALPLAAQTFLVRLGLDDKQATVWDGTIEVENGRVGALQAWQFDADDAIVSDSEWRATSAVEEYWYAPWERSLQGTKRHTKTSSRGLLLRLEMHGPGRVTFDTEQGEFSFEPAEIDWADRPEFLDGAAEVLRTPEPRRVSEGPAAEDFPSGLTDSQGRERLSYITYTHGVGDRLWTSTDDEATALTPDGLDLAGTAMAEDGAGRVWVFWSEQRGGNWDLWARNSAGDRWSDSQRLSDSPDADILPAAASDRDGRIFLTWQGGRDGQFDIFLRVHSGGSWQEELIVSTSASNDWQPAIAASGGEATIVWDSYEAGNYDVRLRQWSNGRLQPVANVTTSEAFEAHADVYYDPTGRLWLAWEEGDADWGKDYVNEVEDAGMGLLMRRQVRVAAWQAGELRELPGDLSSILPDEERQVFLAPKLSSDGNGNLWLFFRYRTQSPTRGKPAFRAMWRQAATSFQRGQWLQAIEFPAGYGRIDASAAVFTDHDGRLHAYWAGDGRTFPRAMPGDPEEPDLYAVTLESGSRPDAPPRLQRFRPPGDRSTPVHPNEADDVARLREYRALIGERSLRIVRGDMHRHTDLSWDGNRDGSLWESYRYALDAAAMDYLGVADHNAGADVPYSWWMIQKAADLFRLPGAFAPLYGYERSRGFPSGHRNVMFAQRGVPVFRFTQAELTDNRNTGVEHLYEHLRDQRGIVMVHTSATGAGSDWTDVAEDVEPLVEIYQGYRTNYEHDGAPRSRTPPRDEQAMGFIWNAWAKGLKLGVQSSSDHVSTHGSYGMIYVDEVATESILEGIRARRAYAATDNILVDFRVDGHLMGESYSTSGQPTISVKVVGTGPIEKVEVIKDNRYVHTHEARGALEVDFEYRDNTPGISGNYYYVRVEQRDGELAWASPIWVN